MSNSVVFCAVDISPSCGFSFIPPFILDFYGLYFFIVSKPLDIKDQIDGHTKLQ